MTTNNTTDTPAQDATKLPRVVWAAGWVSLLTDMSTELVYAVLPAFYQTVLGLNVFWQGAIEGLAEAIASITKLFSGHWSDRTGGRKWWMVGGYGLSSIAKPLMIIPGIGAAGALALRASDRLGKGVRGAPRDALISLSVDQNFRGRAFGVQRAMDHTGAMAGALIAGTLLYFQWITLTHLFFWTLLPGGAAVVIILFFIRDPKPGTSTGEATGKPTFTPRSLIGAYHRQPARFKRFLLVLLVFSLGNSTDALLLFRARDQIMTGGVREHIATACMPFLWALLHLLKSLASAWGGKWSDRVGRRLPLQAGWLVYAMVYAGFATFNDPVAPWVLFAVYGLYFGLVEAPQGALVADLCASGTQRGTAYGLYHFVIGVCALPASLLCGGLWFAVNYHAAFATGAGLALVAMLLLPWALHERPDAPHA